MNRNLVTYALLQMPGIVLFALVLYLLRDWLDIPLWLMVLLVLLWIAKDAAIYPFVRHAYDMRAKSSAETMTGKKGRVKERLDPSGYVQLEGGLWRAEIRQGSAPIEAGKQVVVKGMNGLTLLVEPAGEEKGKA
jgi:membrane-bound serine protease (ClpP class)